MNEWKEYELGDICSRLSSGKGIRAAMISDSAEYAVYGGNGIRGYTSDYNFEGDCAIIGRQGAYCGNVRYFKGKAYMTEHAVIACANDEHNTRYLSYVLSAMSLGRLSGQSAQPGISVKTLSIQKIKMPPLAVQEKIVAVISALEDKIELNTTINENLEQQAQAIYRSMFVTLHHDSDRMGLLSELITVKYGKDHKKLNDGIYPVYGSGGIMRYVERPLYDKESVLIPRKGSLNNVMYVNEPFWSVDTMFYTEMKQPNVAKFVFHFIKSKDLASLNAGSAVPSMTTDILNSMELRIPSADRLAEFEGLVAPLYRALEDNTRQSARLAALRDTLLPKLMNGEIDVSAVKI